MHAKITWVENYPMHIKNISIENSPTKCPMHVKNTAVKNCQMHAKKYVGRNRSYAFENMFQINTSYILPKVLFISAKLNSKFPNTV